MIDVIGYKLVIQEDRTLNAEATIEELLPERRRFSTARILRHDNSCLDPVLKDWDCG